MKEILMEMVKDRVDEKIQETRRETIQETIQETNAMNLKNIMNNLKLTIEQAMDALNIPPSQRELYAGLVNKK